MAVFQPPPTFQESHSGTKPIMEKRAILENPSLPGPSAGRGAFFMLGYCRETSAHIQLTSLARSHGQLSQQRVLQICAYRSSSNTTILKFFKLGRLDSRSVNELEIALRAVIARSIRSRHLGLPCQLTTKMKLQKWFKDQETVVRGVFTSPEVFTAYRGPSVSYTMWPTHRALARLCWVDPDPLNLHMPS
jgi:hypothetical protein